MKYYLAGLFFGLTLALSVFCYGLMSTNASLQARNDKLVDDIVQINTEQSKSERIADNAMRRQVRKIAAKEAEK